MSLQSSLHSTVSSIQTAQLYSFTINLRRDTRSLGPLGVVDEGRERSLFSSHCTAGSQKSQTSALTVTNEETEAQWGWESGDRSPCYTLWSGLQCQWGWKRQRLRSTLLSCRSHQLYPETGGGSRDQSISRFVSRPAPTCALGNEVLTGCTEGRRWVQASSLHSCVHSGLSNMAASSHMRLILIMKTIHTTTFQELQNHTWEILESLNCPFIPKRSTVTWCPL